MAYRYYTVNSAQANASHFLKTAQCGSPLLQALTAISKRHAELGLATCCGGSASAALTTRAEATLACEQIVVPAPGQVEDDQLSLGIVVHGLLGTGRNWRTFVRSLAKQAAAESGR